MSPGILESRDFEYTMFMHLYEEYKSIVNDRGTDGEKLYHRLQTVNTMLDAWHQYIPKGEYAAKKYLQNIAKDYSQVYYWRGLLDKYLGDRYAGHKQAPAKEVFFPAGWEQAFQSIVFASVDPRASSAERTAYQSWLHDNIDWSTFAHQLEQLRKTWNIPISTSYYTDGSGAIMQPRPIKDQPQA